MGVRIRQRRYGTQPRLNPSRLHGGAVPLGAWRTSTFEGSTPQAHPAVARAAISATVTPARV